VLYMRVVSVRWKRTSAFRLHDAMVLLTQKGCSRRHQLHTWHQASYGVVQADVRHEVTWLTAHHKLKSHVCCPVACVLWLRVIVRKESQHNTVKLIHNWCAVPPAGSLAIPLALRGASVSASDISAAMVGEAQERFNAAVAAGQAAPEVAPKFEALDLE
jgi:hypothetical protein